jgi:hypothetical protein
VAIATAPPPDTLSRSLTSAPDLLELWTGSAGGRPIAPPSILMLMGHATPIKVCSGLRPCHVERDASESVFLAVAAPTKQNTTKARLPLIATSDDRDANMLVSLVVVVLVEWDAGEADLPAITASVTPSLLPIFPRIISIKHS